MSANTVPHPSTTGLIIPPPDVREILDHTVSFIARRPEFETRILSLYGGDPRFSFLHPDDPYHAYYKHKCNNIQPNQAQASNASPPASTKDSKSEAPRQESDDKPEDVKEKSEPEPLKQAEAQVSYLRRWRARELAARTEPTSAPEEDVFTLMKTNPMPSIFALEVIKLTAQFAAVHGEDFISGLGRRENRNSTFDFLQRLHPHAMLFRQLVGAYDRILGDGEEKEALKNSVNEMASSEKKTMERVLREHDWDCVKAEREMEAQEEGLGKGIGGGSGVVDWHDFVVVATVDIDETEMNLPAPVADTRQLAGLVKLARKEREEREKNKQDVDMDVDGGGTVADIPMDRVRSGHVDVGGIGGGVENGVAKVALPSGQQVEVGMMQQSVRAELLDARYKGEREKARERGRVRNLADGEEIARNLARRQQKRAGEVFNREDLGKEVRGRAVVNEEEVEKRLGRAKMLGPQKPGIEEDEGHEKKRRRVEMAVEVLGRADRKKMDQDVMEEEIEEEEAKVKGMIKAEEWMKKVGSNAKLRIKVPRREGNGWKLEGQEIEMSAPLKSEVRKLKCVIEKYTKLPVKKQKLSKEDDGARRGGGTLYMKDGFCLADYNLGDGDVVRLEVKERGGRKK